MQRQPKRLKVLYHHRTQGKGVEGTHIRGIVQAFQRAGHEVHVFSPPGVEVEGMNNPESTPEKAEPHKFWAAVSRHTPQALFELIELAYNISDKEQNSQTRSGLTALGTINSLFDEIGCFSRIS